MRELASYYLANDLPTELKVLILRLSGHIRVARKSLAYFFWVPH